MIEPLCGPPQEPARRQNPSPRHEEPYKRRIAFGMLMRQSERPKMRRLLTRSLVGRNVSFANSRALNRPFSKRPDCVEKLTLASGVKF